MSETMLARRLDFPIKELVYTPDSDRVEIRLGQPATMQRDIQPLRAGQYVWIVLPAPISDTHTGTLAIIQDVGEGVVWILRKDLGSRLRQGTCEPRMTRPPQRGD